MARYVIKVNGVEIDHAYSEAKARVASGSLVYAGIATEEEVTVELHRCAKPCCVADS